MTAAARRERRWDWRMPAAAAAVSGALHAVVLVVLLPHGGRDGAAAAPPIEVELVEQLAERQGGAPAPTPPKPDAPQPTPQQPSPPQPIPPQAEAPRAEEAARPTGGQPTASASLAADGPPDDAQPQRGHPDPAPDAEAQPAPTRPPPPPAPAPTSASASESATSPAPPPPSTSPSTAPSASTSGWAANLGAAQDLDPWQVRGENLRPPRPDAAWRNVPPRYPADAARRRASGTVTLAIHVTPAGIPAGIAIARSSGDASLDRSALEAVSLWRFEPARAADGRPVPFDYSLDIRFTLGEP